MTTLVYDVIRATEVVCGLRYGDVIGRGRMQPLASYRQAAMLVARDTTGWSTLSLGRAFRRDHTTILYGLGVAFERGSTDPEYRALLKQIAANVIGGKVNLPATPGAAVEVEAMCRYRLVKRLADRGIADVMDAMAARAAWIRAQEARA